MSTAVAPAREQDQTFKVRRSTIVWILTALLQLGGGLVAYGEMKAELASLRDDVKTIKQLMLSKGMRAESTNEK